MLNSKAQNSDGQVRTRYEAIDMLRALAIILMIIFHTSYDLKIFGYNSINFRTDPLWWTFPRVIVFLFLIPMGQSLQLAHSQSINWPQVRSRVLKLTAFALLISLSTYFLYPTRWIYFGTLHCIALCSLLALPFINRPFTSILAAAILIIPLFFGFKWPWPKLGHASMDYIPALPWLGVVLLGIASNKIGLHRISIPDFKAKRFLMALSKHSLLIYLLHQPLLFGLVWLITKLLPPQT